MAIEAGYSECHIGRILLVVGSADKPDPQISKRITYERTGVKTVANALFPLAPRNSFEGIVSSCYSH